MDLNFPADSSSLRCFAQCLSQCRYLCQSRLASAWRPLDQRIFIKAIALQLNIGVINSLNQQNPYKHRVTGNELLQTTNWRIFPPTLSQLFAQCFGNSTKVFPNILFTFIFIVKTEGLLREKRAK